MLAQVVAICLINQGAIVDMMASIQLVAFGMEFGHSSGSVGAIRRNSRMVSGELLATLRGDVRIVAFSGDIAYGNIGAERFAYTILPSKFDRFLAALLDTEFGGITELTL